MFNQSQNADIYREAHNTQFALPNQPNYSQQINLPRSIQVNNAQLFTAVYWMVRWTLQNMVQNSSYYNPTWNTYSNANFENVDFARFVNRIADTIIQSNAPQNCDFVTEFVVPFIEMDCALCWFDNTAYASQLLTPEMQSHATGWKAEADKMAPAQNQFGNQNSGWGQQQQQQGWGQSQQQQQSPGWQRFGSAPTQQQGWGQSQQQTQRGGSSGFFTNDVGTKTSSTNQGGIRTTTAALERSTSNEPNVPSSQQPSFTSRSAIPDAQPAGGWGSKSTQQLAKESETANPVPSPLDSLLPSNGEKEWVVDSMKDDVVPSSMGNEVHVDEVVTGEFNGLAVSEIICPVLRVMAGEAYGTHLPCSIVQLSPSETTPNGALIVPTALNEFPVEYIGGDKERETAYNNEEFVVVDYVMADYKREVVVASTVAVETKGKDMDYAKHLLSGNVEAVNAVHKVEYAAITEPTGEADLAGLVTEFGEEIEAANVPYTISNDLSKVNARLVAQSAEANKSYEVYGKTIVPFVVDTEFDQTIFARMADCTADSFDEFENMLETLPRDIQLSMSARILDLTRLVLVNKFGTTMNVPEYADVPTVSDYLVTHHKHLVSLWDVELSRIIDTVTRLVPEAMMDEVTPVLSDVEALSETDLHDIVMFEVENYSLYLPYTLSELNISAIDGTAFNVQDASHSKLHNVLHEAFKRFAKTNVDTFNLHLADGMSYKIAKLSTVAKTYSFRLIG